MYELIITTGVFLPTPHLETLATAFNCTFLTSPVLEEHWLAVLHRSNGESTRVPRFVYMILARHQQVKILKYYFVADGPLVSGRIC